MFARSSNVPEGSSSKGWYVGWAESLIILEPLLLHLDNYVSLTTGSCVPKMFCKALTTMLQSPVDQFICYSCCMVHVSSLHHLHSAKQMRKSFSVVEDRIFKLLRLSPNRCKRNAICSLPACREVKRDIYNVQFSPRWGSCCAIAMRLGSWGPWEVFSDIHTQ